MSNSIVKKDQDLIIVGRTVDDKGKIDVSTLPDDVLARCREITRGVRDSESLKSFGADVMNAGSGCGSKLLEMNKIDKAGEVGQHVKALVDAIRETELQDPSNLKGWRKFVAMIPFVGTPAVQSAEKIIAKYESSKGTVDKIVESVKDMQVDLDQDKNVLAVMEDKTIELVEYLSAHVVALSVLHHDEEKKLQDMIKQREEDPSSISQEEISKQREFVEKIDRRSFDLFMAGNKSRNLDLPEIKMMRQNVERLQENAEEIWRTIIPNWENSIALAIMNQKQKKTLETQQMIKDVNNNITLSNAKMLKETTAGILVESSRSVLDVETYNKAFETVLGTLDETFDKLGAIKEERDQARAKIIEINKKAAEKFLQIQQKAEDYYADGTKFIPEALK